MAQNDFKTPLRLTNVVPYNEGNAAQSAHQIYVDSEGRIIRTKGNSDLDQIVTISLDTSTETVTREIELPDPLRVDDHIFLSAQPYSPSNFADTTVTGEDRFIESFTVNTNNNAQPSAKFSLGGLDTNENNPTRAQRWSINGSLTANENMSMQLAGSMRVLYNATGAHQKSMSLTVYATLVLGESESAGWTDSHNLTWPNTTYQARMVATAAPNPASNITRWEVDVPLSELTRKLESVKPTLLFSGSNLATYNANYSNETYPDNIPAFMIINIFPSFINASNGAENVVGLAERQLTVQLTQPRLFLEQKETVEKASYTVQRVFEKTRVIPVPTSANPIRIDAGEITRDATLGGYRITQLSLSDTSSYITFNYLVQGSGLAQDMSCKIFYDPNKPRTGNPNGDWVVVNQIGGSDERDNSYNDEVFMTHAYVGGNAVLVLAFPSTLTANQLKLKITNVGLVTDA